eukprot:gene7567-9012_t
MDESIGDPQRLLWWAIMGERSCNAAASAEAERSEDPGATPQGSKDEPELDLVAVGLTNNSVQIWNWRTQCKCFEVESEEHSLLYSMALSGTAIDDLLVAAGTIFQDASRAPVEARKGRTEVPKGSLSTALPVGVVVYGMPGEEARRRQPDGGALRAPTLHRLLGHEGSVHRVVWDAAGRRIASCSDDRTVRVWQLFTADPVGQLRWWRLPAIGVGSAEEDPSLLGVFGSPFRTRVLSVHLRRESGLLAAGDASGNLVLFRVPAGSAAAPDSAQVHETEPVAQVHGNDDHVASAPSMIDLEADSVIYGHTARLWDCYLHEDILLTASEDCTCRVWRLDGTCLASFQGHQGRGVWRCEYDVAANILISGGADSSIKLWSLPSLPSAPEDRGCIAGGAGASAAASLRGDVEELTLTPPGCEAGLMDSKSEYVRAVALLSTSELAVATNRGLLHYVSIDKGGDVVWQQLWENPKGGPLMCMSVQQDPEYRCGGNLCGRRASTYSLLLGDAKGHVAALRLEDVEEGAEAVPRRMRAHDLAVWVAHDTRRLHTFEAERCEGEDGAVSWQLRRSGTQQAGGIVSVQLEQHTASGEHLIAGFQADDLMVWSCTHQREVLRVNCGGWKRPHALLLGPNPASQACFAFVRDRQVRVWRSWEWAAMRGGDEGGAVKAPPASIHMCFHGREVNAVEILPPPPRRHLTAVGSPEVITGGEDGQLMRTPYTGEGTVEERSGHTHRAEGDVRGAVGAKLAVQAAQKVGEHCSGTAVRQVALAPAGGEGRAWVLATVGAKEALMLWGLTWGEAAPEAGGEAAPVAGRGGQLRSQMLSERARPAHLGHRTWRQEGGAAEGPGALESDQRYLAVKCFCRGDWDSGQTLAVLVHHTKPVLSLSLLDEEASSEPSMYSRLDEEASSEPLMYSRFPCGPRAQDAAAIPKCLDRRASAHGTLRALPLWSQPSALPLLAGDPAPSPLLAEDPAPSPVAGGGPGPQPVAGGGPGPQPIADHIMVHLLGLKVGGPAEDEVSGKGASRRHVE